MRFSDNLLENIINAKPRIPGQRGNPHEVPTERNIPIDSLDEDLKTLLYSSIEACEITFVDLCLQKGATIYKRDYQLACDNNFRQIKELLESYTRKNNDVYEQYKTSVEPSHNSTPTLFNSKPTSNESVNSKTTSNENDHKIEGPHNPSKNTYG